MRNIFLRKQKKRPSVDSDFKKVIDDICKDGGTGTYHLYRRAEDASRRYGIIADGDVKDLRDTDPEHWLRIGYGGGEYELRVDKLKENGMEELVKKYTFYVDGEPKESRLEVLKKKETETSTMLDIFKTSFDYAEKLKGGNEGLALMMGIMQEATKQSNLMFAQMIEMQNKSHESMIRLMQENKNSENPISETLQNLMDLKEFEATISPKLERDATLEWFKAIANNPLLAGLASKFMNVELPQGQQIPMTPVQMPGSTDFQGNGHKPALLGSPSETSLDTKINPLSAKDVQKADPSLVPPNPPDSAELRNRRIEYNLDDTKPDDFESNMIEPFIDAVGAGIDPPNLALILNQIIQWSVTLARIDKPVHPLMRGFADFMLLLGDTDIDFALIDRIYTEFCTGIEMPAELVSPVKTELIKIYMPVFQQIMDARKAGQAKAKESVTPKKPVEVIVNDAESAAI